MSAPVLDAPDSLSRLIPSRVARGFFLAVISGPLLALVAILLVVSALAISRYKVTLD